MTDILFYCTLVLNFAGFLFAAVFLWINISGSYSDLSDRNTSALTITRVSMYISIGFAFLTCLLAENSEIAEAISKTSLLYSIIAVTWLVVIFGCGMTRLLTVMSKKYYKPDISRAAKQLFKISLPGAIICLVLTWLFS